jgi:Mg2+-importing ATPase
MPSLPSEPPATAWWSQPPPPTDPDLGLSAQQVAKIRRRYGENRFIEHRQPPLWRQYLSHFRNPLVLILLLASMVSAMLGELTNFFIIAVIVLASVTLDFFQEHRARNAAEKLRQSIALRARVVRDGVEQSIVVSEIVPGEVVLLKAGDLVPADGLVVEALDCFINQSVLTGESYPVEKHTTLINEAGGDLQAASNALLMGSSVVSGSAKMCVVHTGSSTAMGLIAEHIAAPIGISTFDQGTRKFNIMILRLTMGMVLFVLLVNLLSHKP